MPGRMATGHRLLMRVQAFPLKGRLIPSNPAELCPFACYKRLFQVPGECALCEPDRADSGYILDLGFLFPRLERLVWIAVYAFPVGQDSLCIGFGVFLSLSFHFCFLPCMMCVVWCEYRTC